LAGNLSDISILFPLVGVQMSYRREEVDGHGRRPDQNIALPEYLDGAFRGIPRVLPEVLADLLLCLPENRFELLRDIEGVQHRACSMSAFSVTDRDPSSTG
jgi:hypothetical protein